VDHPIRLESVELAVRPWRTAVLVVAAIAAVELILLVMLGGALLAKPTSAHSGHATAAHEKATPKAKPRKKPMPTDQKSVEEAMLISIVAIYHFAGAARGGFPSICHHRARTVTE